MHIVDAFIFLVYLIAMLGIGAYFLKNNSTTDDYYLGGRSMSSIHIGLSVVATDVGGGFSIGLGGLGFVMGVSGSWLLFTGLLGAWLSAVLLIPKVAALNRLNNLFSFPQFLAKIFNKKVAFVAGLISALGYMGFTSSQILAGAKLASATFNQLSMNQALLIMGSVAVAYTVAGGLKAVIYTDTIQWIVLMVGLMFIALPISYRLVGGFPAIKQTLDHDFLTLTNISWQQLINWLFTIVPVWFIGMTLYQRIYAAKDEKTARRGWFIAGFFEYPLMAFTGVLLGLIARVAVFDGTIAGFSIHSIDPEMGVPLLLKSILPVGLFGIVLSAYFSAIMSTADSCLMASSGNVITDILRMHQKKNALFVSKITTLIIGSIALLLALKMSDVLELMLLSYSFMVSGLFVPVLFGVFSKKPSPSAALGAILTGGCVALVPVFVKFTFPFQLDANIYGIAASLVCYIAISHIEKSNHKATIISI